MPPKSRRRLGALVVAGAGAAAVLAAMVFAWRTQEGADGNRTEATAAASTEIEVASAAPPARLEAPAAPQPVASIANTLEPAPQPVAPIENSAAPTSLEIARTALPNVVKPPKPAAKPGQVVMLAPAASASVSPPATASARLAKPSVWQERR